ncbi:MAG: formylglycine-generating enzyme family protein [Candidatus Latescibacterota bacterium]
MSPSPFLHGAGLLLLAVSLRPAAGTAGMPGRQPGDTLVVVLPGGAQMAMAWVPPGQFTMGSALAQHEALRQSGTWDDWFANERPAHRVNITAGFYLRTCEITQSQWHSVLGMRPWSGDPQVVEGPDYPAVDVSWHDVQVFAARLDQAAGARLYRLPTEAEWEYACRAGSDGAWSFGDTVERLPEHAWYAYNAWHGGEPYAHRVGGLRANAWGLWDMHGNVWEWCQDGWPRPYEEREVVDPVGPEASAERAVRGGNFGSYARSTRAARRGAYAADFRSPGVGARLLRLDGPQGSGTGALPRTWGQVKHDRAPRRTGPYRSSARQGDEQVP